MSMILEMLCYFLENYAPACQVLFLLSSCWKHRSSNLHITRSHLNFCLLWKQWPSLQLLCLILKVFLQQRELNEVYFGGVGSYALLAVLMAMLRVVILKYAFKVLYKAFLFNM
ncbi:uncharacterized protein LOC133313724 [Gastrolobium bilobum]|uniref:uncharacterized protein LOC133313724 n=1 Tax=Gastrolobium bilobum TaxID=150636 RepID=UPI002AB2E515|nr:uncharacterized protein LOC133313724 [Gastrolobium bilobum]